MRFWLTNKDWFLARCKLKYCYNNYCFIKVMETIWKPCTEWDIALVLLSFSSFSSFLLFVSFSHMSPTMAQYRQITLKYKYGGKSIFLGHYRVTMKACCGSTSQIMCAKGIHHLVLIDTLHQPLINTQSTSWLTPHQHLNRCSVDTTCRLTPDQHLYQHFIDSW